MCRSDSACVVQVVAVEAVSAQVVHVAKEALEQLQKRMCMQQATGEDVKPGDEAAVLRCLIRLTAGALYPAEHSDPWVANCRHVRSQGDYILCSPLALHLAVSAPADSAAGNDLVTGKPTVRRKADTNQEPTATPAVHGVLCSLFSKAVQRLETLGSARFFGDDGCASAAHSQTGFALGLLAANLHLLPT